MNRRWIGFFVWLMLSGCLYFFENNTGTRAVLCASILLPLIPPIRRTLFSADQAEIIRQRPLTVKTFSVQEEEDAGDVRPYQPGDPVNRMHWKLSAKRHEWLLRKTGRETAPEERQTESGESQEENSAGRRKKTPVRFCLAALFFLFLCLLLIPEAKRGALALCNQLFEASERVNAYVYDRFSVPAGQSVALAAGLLVFMLALLLGITVLSGSRFLALGIMAGCAAFQMYFGLAFPGWVNVVLFATFVLWLARRPWKPKDIWPLLGALLAVSLTVALFFPGVDAGTEAASERVRDALSQLSRQMTGTVRETSAGENETRHTHTLSLIQGEEEARAEKEYRLETRLEEQISMPRWADYLKIALLLLAAAALVVLPFLPFLWLNARRKKALEIRSAFTSENVSAAVCAIFQQAIRWLEVMGRGAGNLLYRDWAEQLPEGMPPGYAERFGQGAALFEEAAYSDHTLSEDQRRQALSLLEETEQALLARADWKQKLRLRYQDCLWMEKDD